MKTFEKYFFASLALFIFIVAIYLLFGYYPELSKPNSTTVEYAIPEIILFANTRIIGAGLLALILNKKFIAELENL